MARSSDNELSMQYPTNTQELFELAVSSTRTRHSEFGGAKDFEELYLWAQSYAVANNLTPPSKEDCGFFEYE